MYSVPPDVSWVLKAADNAVIPVSEISLPLSVLWNIIKPIGFDFKLVWGLIAEKACPSNTAASLGTC